MKDVTIMIKLATVIPVDVITREQDGDTFALYYNEDDCTIKAVYSAGSAETLDYSAQTKDAIDCIMGCKAPMIFCNRRII